MKCIDHLGNSFASKCKMCEHWKVNRFVYAKRIERGKSIKEALTMDRSIKDHLGNSFKNKCEMCKYWNVEKDTYNYRIKHEKSIKEALTTGINHKQIFAIIYGNGKGEITIYDKSMR